MKKEETKNPYQLMQRFADITKTFIIQGNLKRAEKCLLIANNLFTTGNFLIKNAVANVYVYSLSSLLDCRTEYAKCAMAIMPNSLLKEYEHQVNCSGS